ncbi:MAG: CsbD family protein, partial [Comamonas sp.]
MNKDQVTGAIKDAAGKVQQKAGEVFNSYQPDVVLHEAL